MITKRLRLFPSIFILFLILSGAFGLRAWQLERESLWFDEIYTAELARHSVSQMTQLLLRWGVDPPLHYYAVWVSSRLLGGLGVEIAARLPSVLAGAFTVAALYLAARHLWNRAVGTVIGLIAAGAFVLAPFQVEYAQEARAYAFLVLWTSVAAWGLVWATNDPGPRLDSRRWWHPGWAIWLLGATLALYTHYVAALTIVGLALFGVLATLRLQRQGAARPLLGSLIWLVGPFLLFLPWLVLAGQQFAQMSSRSFGGAGWSGPRMLSVDLVKHMSYVLGAGASSPWRKAIPCLALLGVAAMIVRREWRSLRFTILWFLPSVVFLLAMPLRPFPDRYLILWAPTFFLLVARGIYALAELATTLAHRSAYRFHTALLLGTVCCLALWPGLSTYYGTHKQDWRGVARLVDAAPPLPLYVPWMADIAGFYARPDHTYAILDVRDPDQLRERLLAEPRTWLIVNSIQRAFDPQDRLADAWRSLAHVDLVLWGDLHLIYVGAQTSQADLLAEVERLPLPPSAPLWLSLGRAYRQAADPASAQRVLHQAAQLALADSDPLYLRDIAGELRLLGLHDEAIGLYRIALQRMPQDTETRLGLAVSAVTLQRPEEALAVLAALPAQEAGQYWPARLIGEAYRQQGQLDQALAQFHTAQAANATDPDICALLGMTSHEAGNDADAIHWWQRYLELASQGALRPAACQFLTDHGVPSCQPGQ